MIMHLLGGNPPKLKLRCQASEASSAASQPESGGVGAQAQQSTRSGCREKGRCFPQLWRHYLVLVARPLAVLGQTLQCLVDQRDVFLIDIQTKKSKSTSCASTDTVQKLQRLAHQVVVCLVVLAAKEILWGKRQSRERGRKKKKRKQNIQTDFWIS